MIEEGCARSSASKSRIALAPATAADFVAVFGVQAPWRIRGMTAHQDGQPVALGGLVYAPNGSVLAFYAGTDAVQRFPITITKAVKAGLVAARARGVRHITAECDVSIEAAARWLMRLGFRPSDTPNFWTWEAPDGA